MVFCGIGRKAPYTCGQFLLHLNYFSLHHWSLPFALSAVLLLHGTALATSGCCSGHGGIDFCGTDRYFVCEDGTNTNSNAACVCKYDSGLVRPAPLQYNTAADDTLYYKQLNAPKNTTASCQNRFGEGALAGDKECYCKGGYIWNDKHTACISDGLPAPMSRLDRLSMRNQSRSSSASSKRSSSSASCVIKGNISSKGEKIYHLPGCASYKLTIIDTSAGERMFCSEADAKKAGWRKALNCPK